MGHQFHQSTVLILVPFKWYFVGTKTERLTMTKHEINTLVEQYLKTNSIKKIPQSKSQKDNQPTFVKRSFKRNYSFKN